MESYVIPDLFNLADIETKAVFKACNLAHQALGELKGIVNTMPNQGILLGTLPLEILPIKCVRSCTMMVIV